MLVRQAVQARLSDPAPSNEDAGRARLPRFLKSDPSCARLAMLQRLSTSRRFALGDRAGVLKAAQRRSARPFRLDVRQRVIVKALVSRHTGVGAARAEALGKHITYLGRSGAGLEGARPEFFDRSTGGLDAQAAAAGWRLDRHHFRFIISPEHGDRIADLRDYTREVMRRVAEDLGQPGLAWIGTCHFDTDQPHAHVLVRGRRESGRDLVIPRDYISHGFRLRAQEVAQERLGDLSRTDAERRIWKETIADRFTGFDRRLLAAADATGLVEDGVGAAATWAALTRGRLRHLEMLGLATRVGRRYRLAPDMELRLRSLQLRQDIIRALQQRRLQTGRGVTELRQDGRVRGRVVARGSHDEIGSAPWIIVRDRLGAEHYARLAFGERLPPLGKALELVGTPRGAKVLASARSLER